MRLSIPEGRIFVYLCRVNRCLDSLRSLDMTEARSLDMTERGVARHDSYPVILNGTNTTVVLNGTKWSEGSVN